MPLPLLRRLFHRRLFHRRCPFQLNHQLVLSSTTNSPASFDWSDNSDSDEARPLPPLSSPAQRPLTFPSSSTISAAADPRNLQEVFHNLRTNGLMDYAVKMFDGLSKLGLTREALALFAIIKDKSTMPDVVAHTAVLDAYLSAGPQHNKYALRTFHRMLAAGIPPNSFTYKVLVEGLSRNGEPKEAGTFLAEMVVKGMRPDTVMCVTVFEAMVKGGIEVEGRELAKELREKGLTLEDRAVRERCTKHGQAVKNVMSVLFD